MPGTLFLKLAAALVVVTIAAVGLSAWLNILQFEATQAALVERRLRIVLDDVHSGILIGLDLGLKPSEMEGLDDLLARALTIMPTLHSAVVYDCAGRSLAAAGETVAGATEAALTGHLGEARWVTVGRPLTAAGMTLTDALGDCAGRLVLVLDDAPRQAALSEMSDRLWKTAAFSLLLLAPALAIMHRILRRRRKLITRLSNDLEDVLAATAPVDRHAAGLFGRGALTGGERRMIAAYRTARGALRGLGSEAP